MTVPDEPPIAGGPTDDPILAAKVARLGLRLFLAYLLVYAGFVGLAAFAPALMARAPAGGPNLALLYGLGLIAAAVALAVVYAVLCHDRDASGAGR